jgi:hypothetical protein
MLEEKWMTKNVSMTLHSYPNPETSRQQWNKRRKLLLVIIVKSQDTRDGVMHVPEISAKLFSVSKMTDKGLIVVFTDKGCKIYLESNCKIVVSVEVTGTKVDRIYKLDQVQEPVKAMTANTSFHEL